MAASDAKYNDLLITSGDIYNWRTLQLGWLSTFLSCNSSIKFYIITSCGSKEKKGNRLGNHLQILLLILRELDQINLKNLCFSDAFREEVNFTHFYGLSLNFLQFPIQNTQSNLGFTCLKSTMETPKQFVKSVQC